MSTLTVNVTTRIAWWVMPYLHLTKICCVITGMKPDKDKVVARAMRGVKVEYFFIPPTGDHLKGA